MLRDGGGSEEFVGVAVPDPGQEAVPDPGQEPSGDGHHSDRKGRIVLAVRILTSLAMLAFLVTRVPSIDFASIVPEWSTRTAVFLAGSLFLTIAAIGLSTLRWQQVLTALDVRSDLRSLLRHYLAGQFVSTALPLPSTIGGDALRVSRLAKENGDSGTTFASVVLERLTGWLVLPVITLFALAINPGLRELGTASNVAFLTAVGTLVLLAVILALASNDRIGILIAGGDSKPEGTPEPASGWRRFLSAVHLGIKKLRDRPQAVAAVLAAGFAYQLAIVFAALFAAEALGFHPGPTAMLAFVPAVAIAQVLPVFLAGHGVREAAFTLFLTPLGVAPEQAIALGLLVYLLTLIASLFGAPAFAVGGRRPVAAPASPAALT